MYQRSVSALLIFCCLSIFSGCLTSEYKEYRFTINDDGSGSGTIKFINLVSEAEEGEEVITKDFNELINNYLKGTTFEEDNPQFIVSEKILFEEAGQLCGEIHFTFLSMDSLSFYKHKSSPEFPLMYYMGELAETLIETNGNFLGEHRNFPIIIWEAHERNLYFKTLVTDDMSDSYQLLPLYKALEGQ